MSSSAIIVWSVFTNCFLTVFAVFGTILNYVTSSFQFYFSSLTVSSGVHKLLGQNLQTCVEGRKSACSLLSEKKHN